MESITIRLHLYQQAIEAWFSAPFFGIGWGEYAYYLYENSDKTGMDRNAHNIILHFMAETGLVGTSCLILGIYYSLPRTYNAYLVGLYGIIGVQLIHSMLEFPYAYMQFLIIAGLCIGMTHAKD